MEHFNDLNDVIAHLDRFHLTEADGAATVHKCPVAQAAIAALREAANPDHAQRAQAALIQLWREQSVDLAWRNLSGEAACMANAAQELEVALRQVDVPK